jgi:diguanylate cyclase (GGDEF)-like protein
MSDNLSDKLSEKLSTVNYFALVCGSALAISLTVSVVILYLGVPIQATDYVRLNLFVTGCIAVPTAIIATLNNFHTQAYQRRLEALAWTDELTGLLNRRFFMRAAGEECERMRRTQRTAAVALIDLDYFKQVNDVHGHAAGDRVLKRIAQIAHTELRGPFDKLGRWGGEEFIFLLSEVTPEHASAVCERLRGRIEEALIESGESQIRVTASFGYCMLRAGSDVSVAIEAADRALYEAKRLGRNRVEIADAPPAEVPDLSAAKKRPEGQVRMLATVDEGADAFGAASMTYSPRSSRQPRVRGSR